MEYDRHVWSSVAIRLALGAVFLFAGIMKLFLNVAPPVEKIIFFLPKEASVSLLGIVEFVVGILLIVGLLTRAAAVVAGLLLAGFILSAFALGIFTAQFIIKDFVLLAATLHLIMHESAFSIDAWINRL